MRAAVWGANAWRTAGSGISAAADWAARTVRPAGVLIATAASAGLLLGMVFGWVEWMVAGAASLVLVVAAIPF